MSNQNSMIGGGEIPFNTLIDNRYLIQRVLGQGGLGKTYLAWDTHCFNEPCVLKEFAPFGSEHYDLEKSRNLFKREAEILYKITHPQIPRFIACFETQQRLFLVQEYVTGQTFSALLEKRQQQQKTFTEEEIAKWLEDLLPILDYIHQLGIIHRDISPDNIMQPQGRSLPVLIDFGVGKLIDLSDRESSRKHSYVGKLSFVGKMGYAPKEQITMGRCSPSSDIYALGVTALVLLTGKEPTALINQFSLEWEWQKYAQVNTKLAKILSQMTEEKPLNRYQSAQEVLNELKDLKNKHTEIKPSSSSDHSYFQPPKKDETVILSSSSVTNSSSTSKIDETLIVTGVNSNPSYEDTGSVPLTNNPTSTASNLNSETKFNQTPQSVDQTMIISSVTAEPPATGKIEPTKLTNERSLHLESHSPSKKPIPPEFIRRCEQELAYCIGPIASFVVQEVMEKKRPQSPHELITALAEYLPDRKQMKIFRQRFT